MRDLARSLQADHGRKYNANSRQLTRPNWINSTRLKHIQALKASKEQTMTTSTERAVLAGGCFWGMQDLFRRQPGVVSTRVGYAGGDVLNATYRNHGNHAESIEIIF